MGELLLADNLQFNRKDERAASNVLVFYFHLCNLNNVKNTEEGVLLLVKFQVSFYNFTKSNIPPWVFFTFLNLYK